MSSIALTEPDCTLDGERIPLVRWPELSSAQLKSIVRVFAPSRDVADKYEWSFTFIPLTHLIEATEDGATPDGGWEAAYRRQLAADARAIAAGSPEYAGRDAWMSRYWTKATAIFPLFVVEEDPGEYYLWDGHHRLAGAFTYRLSEVAVILGKRVA